jgi:hypothetical protein
MKEASKIISKKTPYEDACALQGIKPLTIDDFAALDESERQATYSFHRISTVTKAARQGVKVDWSNFNQRKYSAWLAFNAGSGFSYDGYVSTLAATGVGARLCTFSPEDAKYIAQVMIEDFNHLFTE